MADIHGIEADDGHEEADICLRKLVADEVVLTGEYFLQAVERAEKRDYRRFVRLLGRSKP